jgi:hypothetical protein
MIHKNPEYLREKKAAHLEIGDIIQRKSDKLFYELLNITKSNTNSNENREFFFYGFNIYGMSNICRHFIHENGNLKIYKRA